VEKIAIFDTTLRDGEQAVGAALTLNEKVAVAKSLERLGADIIEAGFPVSSKTDFLAVRQAARTVKTSKIAAFARAKTGDIDAAAEAFNGAENARIHIFLAASDIHLIHKLKMTREQAKEAAIAAVKYARNFCGDVEFSFEDACRADIDYLRELTRDLVSMGARTINVPDTIGLLLPQETAAMIRAVADAAEDRAIISAHCHDDMGLATANTIAAIEAGARQVEATINGIGERAGNAALEEVAAVIAARFAGRFETRINTRLLGAVSEEVARLTGLPKAANKAIVGKNAFSHGSGIHQDGVLKRADTYEALSGADFGASAAQIVLTRHSGRRAVREKADEIGVNFASESDFERFFAAYKTLAETRKIVPTEALRAIAI
jgi:2-isopropylmalate synthase